MTKMIKMTKSYKSEIFAAIHETAEALHGHGVIDKMTMREFDESCLAPVKDITPDEIRTMREREKLSQPSLPVTLTFPKILSRIGSEA